MKVGLVARCDDRGLGLISWEVYRHVQPDRTLVVLEPGAINQGFVQHVDRYPETPAVMWEGGRLDVDVVRRFLRGLDVVYSAETFYDDRLVDVARDMGVRTVLHVMPEFWNGAATPDVLWAPTTWRLGSLPAHTRLVPVPVALDRFPTPSKSERLTLLHIVGHHAAADRAGTTTLLRSLRNVRSPLRLRVITQDRRLPAPRLPGQVDYEPVLGSTRDYWRLYDDADVLVAPRRYGGLSLPFGEAAAAGLALILSDVPPNRYWPGTYVPAVTHGALRTAAGDVPIFQPDVAALAATIDALATDETQRVTLQRASREWAVAHSWNSLLPMWRSEFERACS